MRDLIFRYFYKEIKVHVVLVVISGGNISDWNILAKKLVDMIWMHFE